MNLFKLSPILSQQENQIKIQDMIERTDDMPEIIIEGVVNSDLSTNQESVTQVVHEPPKPLTTQSLNIKKTSDQIRRGFMSKLTYEKVWLTPLEKPKLYETAIIFDWDDTILCTSFINPTGVFNPN
jgi:hypothetical protein